MQPDGTVLEIRKKIPQKIQTPHAINSKLQLQNVLKLEAEAKKQVEATHHAVGATNAGR